MIQNENDSPERHENRPPGLPDADDLSFFPSGGIDRNAARNPVIRAGADAADSTDHSAGPHSAANQWGPAASDDASEAPSTSSPEPARQKTVRAHPAPRIDWGAQATRGAEFAKDTYARVAPRVVPTVLAFARGLRAHLGKIVGLALSLLVLLGGLYIASGFLPENWRKGLNSVLAVFGTGDAINLDEIHVKVLKLEQASVVPELSALGVIEYYEKVSISSKTAGRIERIPVREGDRVRAGQTIVQIERLPLELELRKQKAALAAAESQLKLAREQYMQSRQSVEARVKEIEKRETTLKELRSSLKKMRFTYEGKKTLFQEAGISREEYETVRQELVSAEASYLSAKKDLEISKIGFRPEDLRKRGMALPKTAKERVSAYADLNTLTEKASVEVAESRVNAAREELYSTQRLLEETTIVSPINGLVAVRNKSVGEEVRGGGADSAEQAILVIIEMDRVYATINVRESDLKSIKEGQKIRFSVDVYPEEEFIATVQIIKPLIDQQTHTAEVKGVVPNQDHRLRSGMFIRARVATGEAEERILVPDTALIPRSDNKAWAFVIREDKAYRVEVVTGRQFDDRIEIVEGLKAGDIIAVEKLSQLWQGVTITPDYTHL
jgi:RND family efflux transporter MFP subunit